MLPPYLSSTRGTDMNPQSAVQREYVIRKAVLYICVSLTSACLKSPRVAPGLLAPRMAHYDIFRNLLAVKYPAYGHALWDPSPGTFYSAVAVGDVGIIREGKFHRLFNALLRADHPSHRNLGVPEYHEPLLPSIHGHIYSGTLASHDFYSRGVIKAPSGLEVSATEYMKRAHRNISCL
jgi:hypothetical protein